MKLFIITPVAYSFWNYPTHSLLAIVALLFIVQLIGELMSSKIPTNDSYEEIKELFNNGLDEEVDESVQTVSTTSQIECIELTLDKWSYSDLSTLCRLHGLKPKSRKKLKLIESLEGLL